MLSQFNVVTSVIFLFNVITWVQIEWDFTITLDLVPNIIKFNYSLVQPDSRNFFQHLHVSNIIVFQKAVPS